jgi:hypothetical protein
MGAMLSDFILITVNIISIMTNFFIENDYKFELTGTGTGSTSTINFVH